MCLLHPLDVHLADKTSKLLTWDAWIRLHRDRATAYPASAEWWRVVVEQTHAASRCAFAIGLLTAPAERFSSAGARCASDALRQHLLDRHMGPVDFVHRIVPDVQRAYDRTWPEAARVSLSTLQFVAGEYLTRCHLAGAQLVAAEHHLLHVALIERYGGLERALADTGRGRP
jgi:hypothetical protein